MHSAPLTWTITANVVRPRETSAFGRKECRELWEQQQPMASTESAIPTQPPSHGPHMPATNEWQAIGGRATHADTAARTKSTRQRLEPPTTEKPVCNHTPTTAAAAAGAATSSSRYATISAIASASSTPSARAPPPPRAPPFTFAVDEAGDGVGLRFHHLRQRVDRLVLTQQHAARASGPGGG